ncbi:MAG: hypothetical protein V3U24_08530 [Candidatus Neomarinimicrobiota bacterium]
MNKKRAFLILVALFTGGAVPIQLVTLSFGYAEYVKDVSLGPRIIRVAHEFASGYIPFVYIPALLILLWIIFYSKKRYRDLFRRIVVGLGVGALATVSLDYFREMGVINGWLPGDTVAMFGKMGTGSRSFSVYYPAGAFIHFMNGANFGLFYTFVWGKQKNYSKSVFWAVVWLLMMELGMMIGPPMAPIVGLFGINFAWPQYFLLTLTAHITFGIVLGILSQYLLTDADRGGLLPFLKG